MIRSRQRLSYTQSPRSTASQGASPQTLCNPFALLPLCALERMYSFAGVLKRTRGRCPSSHSLSQTRKRYSPPAAYG